MNFALFCLELVPKSAFFEAILLVLDNRRTLDIFRTVIFRHFFQSKKLEFDRAARSRSPVLFFFAYPRFSEQWRYRDCARICVLLKHKRCGFKEIFQFHFCEKSNKRIHFNYEEIWFFSKSDILVEFWFGLFVFKLVKVRTYSGAASKEPTGLHHNSLPRKE